MTERVTVSIGREELTDQLLTLLRARGARGVVLVGAAGIGKTHIARVVGESMSTERSVIWLTGSAAGADVPFSAFAPLMPFDPGTEGRPPMMLVRKGLAEVAAGKPVLIVIDDVHELDEASAALLLQLAWGGDVTVVATQRAGAPSGETVARLWRDDVLRRIDLEALDLVSTGRLVEALIGHPASGRSIRSVFDRTAGNPLYTRELVLATLDGGEWAPLEEGDEWEWNARDVEVQRLSDLLTDRLSSLDEAERDALVHIAFGEPLGLGELQAIASDEVIDRLERAGLITADVDRRRLHIRISHPMHADVVRRSVSALRARSVRATLLAVLRATGARRREDAMRLAVLSLDAGVDVDVAILRQATAVALTGVDGYTAIRLAEEAFRREPDFGTGRALADALYPQASLQTISDHWANWEPLAQSEAERAVVALHRAATYAFRHADFDAANEVLDELDELVPQGRWRDESRSIRGMLLAIAGRPRDSISTLEPLLVEGDRVMVRATIAACHALRALGQPARALELVNSAIERLDARRGVGESKDSASLQQARCLALFGSGDFAECLRAAELSKQLALRSGDTYTEGMAELFRSETLSVMGRFEDAARAARAAELVFVRTGDVISRRLASAHRCAALAGGAPSEDLGAALLQHDALPDGGIGLNGHAAAIARACYLAATGERDAGLAILRDTASELMESGEATTAALCLHGSVLLGARDAAEPLARLAESTEDALVPLFAEHARAFEAGDAAGLVAVAERFAEIGAISWAIPAAEQASRITADTRSSSRGSALVTTWLPQCQFTAAMAEVVSPVSAVTPLTRREREVALLAAQGLPSRTIGERLFLSSRTVENHLARAYDKLGVRSRAELAHALAAA